MIATESWLITRLLFMNIITILNIIRRSERILKLADARIIVHLNIFIIIKRSDCHLKLADDKIVAVQLQTLVPPHHHVASSEHSWTLVMIMVMVMMVTVVKRGEGEGRRCYVV